MSSRCRSPSPTSSRATASAPRFPAIVAADLKRSGLFAPIDKGAFIEKISNPDAAPRFEDWKVINAQALVTGRVTQEADGRLRAEFRLWDTFAGQQLIGEQFFANKANSRRVAHIIADAIYERLTGEKGYFDTRVVFIDESGPKNERKKRLAIMDQDGANVRYLSDGRVHRADAALLADRQEITYMSYESGQPRVYLLQIETGQRELVGNFPGMTFAPRFSPDGQKVIMSLLRDDGNSNIFTMDLRSRTTTRLTNSSAIDTSPSYSPDGSQIVFTSDRGGQPQIYVDGRRRLGPDAHLVRRRQLFDAGLVAARRPDRLHQADRRRVPDRRDAHRRLGRAHPVLRLPAGGPDLGAERPRADVLPRGGRLGRPEAGLGRSHRPQRAGDPDGELRVGPGLVAAARIGARKF